MSEASTKRNTTIDGDRFPSLAALREANNELLKRHREHGTPSLLADIEQFMAKGQAAGAVIDDDEDRWTAQSLLDYWSSLLYRAGHAPPDSTLMEFDPMLAPALDDSLCPYMGLDAFRQETHDFFFGRQRLIDRLIRHLEEHRFLIVVGSSGSGKSSLVLGGVLPRLLAGALPDSETWHYYDPMVPGSDPLIALARRLQPDAQSSASWIAQQIAGFRDDDDYLMQLVNHLTPHPAVLVVDQFEEVFTLCRDQAMRTAFINNLLTLAQAPNARHTLILTMRTDFESQLVRHPQLLALFEQFHFRVTALDANELRETIAKPAELVGLKLEEGLVDALASDVLGEPAALPLLQFTLLQLWSNRERNRVTWEAYRRLGGGRLALAKSADQFYEGLIPEEQQTVKRILLSMVRPTEGLEVTSNRILRQDLYRSGEAGDRIDRVLTKLTQARLIRLSDGANPKDTQVEVAHEALIRNWPRLIDWLENERIKLRERYRLTDEAEQWYTQGKADNSLLASGQKLKEFQRYASLNEVETEYIKASKKLDRQRIFIRLISLSAAIILISLIIFFNIKRQKAETSEREAKEELRDSEAKIQEKEEKIRKLQEELEEGSHRLDQQNKEERRAKERAKEAQYNLKRVQDDLEVKTEEYQDVEERNQKLIEEGNTTKVKLNESQARLQDNQQKLFDSERALEITNGQIEILNNQERYLDARVEYFENLASNQAIVSTSPEGADYFLTLDDQGVLKVWDLQTNSFDLIPNNDSKFIDAVMNSNGTSVAILNIDDEIQIWDVNSQNQKELSSKRKFTRMVFSPIFPDQLATVSPDDDLCLWNIIEERNLGCDNYNDEGNDEDGIDALTFTSNGENLIIIMKTKKIHRIPTLRD